MLVMGWVLLGESEESMFWGGGLLGGGLWVCDFLTTKLVMKWEVGILEVGLWGGLGIALGWGVLNGVGFG